MALAALKKPDGLAPWKVVVMEMGGQRDRVVSQPPFQKTAKGGDIPKTNVRGATAKMGKKKGSLGWKKAGGERPSVYFLKQI